MQRQTVFIEDAQRRRESAVEAGRAPTAPSRPRAEGDWLSSSFDLAQGLDVKVMESKLSRETLDKLFRS